MKIAIPSYRRSSSIFENTISSLLNAGVNLDDVTVFISDPGEREDYEREIGAFVKIVDSVKTLTGNRSFILNYYPKGEKIIMCDDDIKSFNKVSADGKKLVQANLYEYAEKGFKYAEQEGLSTWGIYAASNPFFMSKRVTKGLFYTIGSCFGIINTGAEYHHVIGDEKEDYARSLKIFDNEHGMIRLEGFTVVSAYYTQPGGLQENRTKERVEVATKELAGIYPDYCKPYIRKTTGFWELRLNNAKYKTTVLENY